MWTSFHTLPVACKSRLKEGSLENIYEVGSALPAGQEASCIRLRTVCPFPERDVNADQKSSARAVIYLIREIFLICVASPSVRRR
jgi:hypothetical protein